MLTDELFVFFEEYFFIFKASEIKDKRSIIINKYNEKPGSKTKAKSSCGSKLCQQYSLYGPQHFLNPPTKNIRKEKKERVRCL